jgi:DNA-binding CsgD family transcriptional regulator
LLNDRRINGTASEPMTHTVYLTPRERDVVRRVVAGRTNREIADELGLTIQAVKNLLSTVFLKCHVRNRVELTLFVLRHVTRSEEKNHR